MQRLVAKLILSVGLMAGVAIGSTSVAGAATHAATDPVTTGCYPSCPQTQSSPPVTNPLSQQQPQITTADAPSPTPDRQPADRRAGGGTVSTADSPALADSPATATPDGSRLAFTGSDVAGMVVVAFVLVGAGLGMIRLSRRHRSA